MQKAPCEILKLEKPLLRRVGKAIKDYNLIAEGDKIAIALSGGKDSWSLLHILNILKKRAPVHFDLIAVTIHNGSGLFQENKITDYLRENGYKYHVEKTNIYNLVQEKRREGSLYCSLCARFRRAFLYKSAAKLGCNKVALGHHLDDAIETLFLNLFFEGRTKAMPPILKADNGIHTLIRPLIYVEEEMLLKYAAALGFPIIDCGCWLCGGFDMKRKAMKTLIASQREKYPQIKGSILSAMKNIDAGYLLDNRYLKNDTYEKGRRKDEEDIYFDDGCSGNSRLCRDLSFKEN